MNGMQMSEKKPIYETTWRAQYHRYLRSPEWKDKKERVLRRDGYQCRSCQGIPATEVHHTTYRYGRYTPDYLLVSLCSHCHGEITKIDNGEIEPWDFSDIETLEELPY